MPRARGRQIPCGGNANIMLPGFSMTAGIMEVMTIAVAYSTRENSMKFTNHATKCCDGISLSDAFEFTICSGVHCLKLFALFCVSWVPS